MSEQTHRTNEVQVSNESYQTIETSVHWNNQVERFEGQILIRLAPGNQHFSLNLLTRIAHAEIEYQDQQTQMPVCLEVTRSGPTEIETDAVVLRFQLEHLENLVMLVRPATLTIVPVVESPHHIFILKGKVNSEDSTIDILSGIEQEHPEIVAALFPRKANGRYLGYWFLETTLSDPQELSRTLFKLHLPSKILGEVTNSSELFQYHTVDVIERPVYSLGDIVLILVKPFKNERAKVIELLDQDPTKIVVQLLTTGLPVPITIDQKDLSLVEARAGS